ncbi:MAG TPA: tetratricopeptide repeat protein [Blastocatellia bacterium]|nr:tetratricopeptide repeat protein [Blastocatellia bacterium]
MPRKKEKNKSTPARKTKAPQGDAAGSWHEATRHRKSNAEYRAGVQRNAGTHPVSGSPQAGEPQERPGRPESRSRTRESQRSGQQSASFVEWNNLYSAVPVILAVIASANTLTNGFVADDRIQVLQNQFITSLANIPRAFTTSVWSFGTGSVVFANDAYFRPMFNILFSIDYALFGKTAWGWHLSNLLIHSCVVYFVFITVRELTEDRWLALIAASLFAVHPVHAEPVAWVSGITDGLLALFALPSFYYYLCFRRSRRKLHLTAALVLYLLALLTKETAIALPAIVAFMELWYFKNRMRLKQRFANAAAIVGLMAVPTAIYIGLRMQALSGLVFGTGPAYPILNAVETVPVAIVKYLALALVPKGYSYQHQFALAASIVSSNVLIAVAGLTAAVVALALARNKELTFSAVWFLLWLGPALAVLRRADPEFMVQERYLYIPSVGLCLGLALGIRWLANPGRRWARGPIAGAVVTAGLVIGLAAAAVRQNRVWTSDITLYQNCVAVEPTLAVAHASLAQALYDGGDKAEASAEAATALNLDPGESKAYLTLSYIADGNGKPDQAIYYLKRGTAAVPQTPMTRYGLATMYLNLGMLYQRERDSVMAEQNMKRSLEVWPRPVGWYYMGQFYYAEGRFEDALAMFEKEQDSVPSRFASIHLNLAKVYDQMKDKRSARREYLQYLKLNPSALDRDQILQRLSEL